MIRFHDYSKSDLYWLMLICLRVVVANLVVDNDRLWSWMSSVTYEMMLAVLFQPIFN